MTIDTYSDIPIIRADVLNREIQEKIQPVDGWIRTATGKQEPFHGISQLAISIVCWKIPETLWVAGIHD